MKLRYGLRLLFILLTLAAVACAVPGIWRQIQFRKFVSFADRDLRDMTESERITFSRISSIFVSVNGEPWKDFIFGPTPWYVWPVETENRTRYLYLKGSPCYVVPGISSAHLQLFDSWGRVIAKTEFSTGYRITINDANVHTSSANEFIFRVQSEPVINGRNVAMQYYALTRDQIVLIRLEDAAGKPIVNLDNHFRIGGPSPEFIVNDWRKLIEGVNRVECLAALEYLQCTPQPESTESLRKLLTNQDSWIADSARLAMLELGEVAVPSE